MYKCRKSTIVQLVPSCMKFQINAKEVISVTKLTSTVVIGKIYIGDNVYRFNMKRKQLDDNFMGVKQ